MQRRVVLHSALLLVLVSGCGAGRTSPDRYRRGLVIVLTGIEGRSPLNAAICKGLDQGGVDWAIELTDWTAAPLVSLLTQHRNRRIAKEVAERIARYQKSYPNRPVVLVGHSGGAAMAIWIAEAMPPGEHVDGLVLLAAAISPEYMLDNALRRTRRGIVNFYSPKDYVLLGWGTRIFGAMDREHKTSAGRVGFEVPKAGGTPRAYTKLYQIAWSKQMAAKGHTGSHFSVSTRAFVGTYVAPFVLTTAWSPSMIPWLLEKARRTNPKDQAKPPPRRRPGPGRTGASQKSTHPRTFWW